MIHHITRYRSRWIFPLQPPRSNPSRPVPACALTFSVAGPPTHPRAQEEWSLVLSELLGMPARTMGALAEAGQNPSRQQQLGVGGGLVSGIVGIAGFVMGMADMAEMALGGHRCGEKGEKGLLLPSSRYFHPHSILTRRRCTYIRAIYIYIYIYRSRS